MSDADEITADDVRAGLRDMAAEAADCVRYCEEAIADGTTSVAHDDLICKVVARRVRDYVQSARDRRLSERAYLAAEARADAERERFGA